MRDDDPFFFHFLEHFDASGYKERNIELRATVITQPA